MNKTTETPKVDLNEVKTILDGTESLHRQWGYANQVRVPLSSGAELQARFFASDLYQLYIKVKGQKLKHVGSYDTKTKTVKIYEPFAA